MTSPGSALSFTPARQSPAVPHRYSHDAMACTWELYLPHVDATYGEQVSWAAFEELDRLERELSRFIPSSDVARINALEPGEAIRVGLAALECLRLAQEIHQDTDGAFDVTIGALIDQRRDANGWVRAPDASDVAQRAPVGMELLDIDFDEFTVGRRAAGPRIDLGAVGKGYALDCIAQTLHDWDIAAALLHSGQSTVLALGSPDGEQPWAVALRSPQATGEQPNLGLGEVYLFDRALSGSGRSERGQHIIDPRTGGAASDKIATWAIADSAARSDALSTAFMVLEPGEVERYCEAHPNVVGLLLVGEPDEPTLLSYGQFARFEAGE